MARGLPSCLRAVTSTVDENKRKLSNSGCGGAVSVFNPISLRPRQEDRKTKATLAASEENLERTEGVAQWQITSLVPH